MPHGSYKRSVQRYVTVGRLRNIKMWLTVAACNSRLVQKQVKLQPALGPPELLPIEKRERQSGDARIEARELVLEPELLLNTAPGHGRFWTRVIGNGESPICVKEQVAHASIKITVDSHGDEVPGPSRQGVNRPPDPSTVTPESARKAGTQRMNIRAGVRLQSRHHTQLTVERNCKIGLRSQPTA